MTAYRENRLLQHTATLTTLLWGSCATGAITVGTAGLNTIAQTGGTLTAATLVPVAALVAGISITAVLSYRVGRQTRDQEHLREELREHIRMTAESRGRSEERHAQLEQRVRKMEVDMAHKFGRGPTK